MRRLILIIAVVMATALTVWLFMRERAEAVASKITVVSDGPLDIRLWGIRPDDGDTIYDPNGKVIKETFGIAMSDLLYRGERSQRFDFIFELPPTYEPSRFEGSVRITPGGEDGGLGGGSSTQFLFDYEGRRLLWRKATFPRTFERSILGGLWKSDATFDTVDLTLSYYSGLPGKSTFSLKGPFEPNSTVSSEDTRYEVSFKDVASNSRGLLEFKLSMGPPFRTNLGAFVYDVSGNRRLAGGKFSWSSSRVGQIDYEATGISLNRVAIITFGEEYYPHKITFNNVNLHVAGRKRRTYAAYLDKMSERLGLTVAEQDLAHYKFKNAAEALEVIDIVRDHHLLYAAIAILREPGRIDPAELTDEQAKRLRQTLARWLKAVDPRIQAYAVEIGLLCKWPEFVESALEMLERPVVRGCHYSHDAQVTAAGALRRYAAELSEEQVRRIEDLLLDESRKDIHSSLRRVLKSRAAETRD